MHFQRTIIALRHSSIIVNIISSKLQRDAGNADFSPTQFSKILENNKAFTTIVFKLCGFLLEENATLLLHRERQQIARDRLILTIKGNCHEDSKLMYCAEGVRALQKPS